MQKIFLPGNIRERIRDLLYTKNMSQAQLAKIIGLSESAFSRFMSGSTLGLDHEYIIRIAREFNVSTDFLLGIIDVSDRSRYDISELGLSVQAARNLYTQRVDPRVVTYLLETPSFAKTAGLIAQYLSGELAAGIAAHNELFDQVSQYLGGHGSAAGAAAVRGRKISGRQELDAIQESFAASLQEIRRDVTLEVAAKKMTDAQFQAMLETFTKGEERPVKNISPKEFAGAILSSIQNQELLSEHSLQLLEQALTAVGEDLQKGHGKK